MKSFSADRIREAYQCRSERRFADIGLRILALVEILVSTVIGGLLMQLDFAIGLAVLLALFAIVFVTTKILLDDVQVLYDNQIKDLYGESSDDMILSDLNPSDSSTSGSSTSGSIKKNSKPDSE